MIPHLRRCQGFAVRQRTLADGFTLGRLGPGASLLRRIFDLDFCTIEVFYSDYQKYVPLIEPLSSVRSSPPQIFGGLDRTGPTSDQSEHYLGNYYNEKIIQILLILSD